MDVGRISGRVEDVNLRSLIAHEQFLMAGTSLEEVQRAFQQATTDFMAVVEESKVVGLCSRTQISSLLGTRFGFSIHGRKPVSEHLVPNGLIFPSSLKLLEVLDATLQREGAQFYEDIVLVDAEGKLIGLIETRTLVALQSRLVAEKMAELEQANGQLENARDEALQAAKAKAEFLAMMSHEIRTPMNGVMGMLTLLADTGLNLEQRDFAETARTSAECLLTVINDILDFSKLEAGKAELESQDFKLREVVESVVMLMAEKAQSKGLEMNCWLEPEVPVHLCGDANRLRQVLMNLTGNAVKFTAQGEITVQVSYLCEAPAGPCVRFAVKDTGVGISAEVQGKLFQPFSQADSSTTRRFGGTGLGLSISRRLVELMGGVIGVTSTLGQGATFWFELPLRAAQLDKPVDAAEFASFEGNVVLLAVPPNSTREMLVQMLGNRGVKCIPCKGVFEMQAWLKMNTSRQVDLLLVDSIQPGCDGAVMVQGLKALAGVKAKAILLAPLSRYLDAGELARLGIDGGIHKPVRQDEMMRLLRRVLPTKLDLQPAEAKAASIEGHDKVKIDTGNRPIVLLVEDNIVNQRVASLMLRKLGYGCEAADCGEVALQRVRQQFYPIILMDRQMPDLDGLEVTRQIRGLEAKAGQHAFIIAMTADAMPGDREKCLAAEMDDYVSKPVDINELQRALKLGMQYFASHRSDIQQQKNT